MPNLVARLIGHTTGISSETLLPDNLVHLLLGGFLLGTGWAAAEYPTRPRFGRAFSLTLDQGILLAPSGGRGAGAALRRSL